MVVLDTVAGLTRMPPTSAPLPPLELAEHVSLLWPTGTRPATELPDQLADSAAADLNLTVIVAAMIEPGGSAVTAQRHMGFIRRTLSKLVTRADVILYRQEVLEDLLASAALRDQCAELLPALESLSDVTGTAERYRLTERETIERVVRRLGDLELLVDVTHRLAATLREVDLHARALLDLRAEVLRLLASEAFKALETELPELRATLARVRSLTIGVNLGADLLPESATILEFGTERIDGRRGLLGRLLGGVGAQTGLTPLQRGDGAPMGGQNDLVRDLNRLIQRVTAPIAAALDRYTAVSGRGLARLAPELAFFLGGVRLVQHVEAAGLPTCRADLVGSEVRRTWMSEAYDPGLVLRQEHLSTPSTIVTNPVVMDDASARVWVLTGPNRGGKTTYVRAMGIAQVLAQAGLRVPAARASLSPVDAIYTHFPMLEPDQPGQGRLDQEAARVAAIFKRATPNSLILLNEALAGTSAFEALDLARGIVRGLRLLGARAIYVTHLHDLANAVDDINRTTPGASIVGSLVAEPGPRAADGSGGVVRTFRIQPGQPRGQSFAVEIAEQHGISFELLAALLRARGLTE
jgi:hypothetical protein